MDKKVLNKLKKITKVKDKCLLKDYTSIKIGGPGVLVEPENIEELVKTLDILKSSGTKYFVLGNGTNVIFDSLGFDGVIIKLSRFKSIDYFGTKVVVDAGVNLSAFIKQCADKGLGGMEDGFLIPGTVGGAIKMNAGAYGYKTSDVVSDVLVLRDNKIRLVPNAQCEFGYRTSGFKDGDIILKAQFELTRKNKTELKNRMSEIIKLRSGKPKLPSAGSVFKNAEGYYAGQLIDSLGLKGLKSGDAMISQEHANVIVNTGSATSDDVNYLIRQIQNKVKECYDIDLQTEINLIK